jgi:multisubunit Na+/H+ antiporter MnhC subunit
VVAIIIFAFTYLLIIAERITKYGVGVMLISVAISNLYLWFGCLQ